jgi:hypothetical protein
MCLGKAIAEVVEYAVHHPKNPSPTLESGVTVTVGASTVGLLSFPVAGDQTVAYRITTPVEAKSLELKAYVDLIALRKGRAFSGLTFRSLVSPTDITTEERLTALTASRLRKTE